MSDLVPRVREKDPHSAYDNLSEFQQRFVDAYVGPADGNPKRAARFAGWALCNVPDAMRIYRVVEVQKAIREVLRSHAMSPEAALERLTRLASSNIANLRGPDGKLLPLEQIEADDAYIIRDYQVTPTKYGDRIHIRVHDPGPALIKILQRWGVLANDKLEIDHQALQDAITRGLEELSARAPDGDVGADRGGVGEDVIEASFHSSDPE